MPKGHSLGEFANYQDATKLVERLIAGDFAPTKISIIGHDPVDIDTLAGRCGLTVDALYAILLPLELDGHLARLPGGRLQRT